MKSTNYSIGASFERRFLNQLLDGKIAVKGARFYGSKGITDLWWVDRKGIHNEAQLKYSTQKTPYISPAEMQRLREFARKMDGLIKVWVVLKQSRQAIDMRLVT